MSAPTIIVAVPFIGGHLWVIVLVFLIVLIIWGPGRLPLVGGGLGKAIRDFRKSLSDRPEGEKKETKDNQAESPPAKRSSEQ